MRISPMGMNLEDLPGMPESLRATIVKILTKRMVEPKYLTVDVQRIFNRLCNRRRGGDGGLLWTSINTLNGPFSSTESMELYCEFEFQGGLFRTPIKQSIQSFAWDWSFNIELNIRLSEKEDQVLEIRIFRISLIEEASLFASGEVVVNRLGLVEGRESSGHSIALTGANENARYTLHLTLQLKAPSVSTSFTVKPSDTSSSSSSLDSSNKQLREEERYQLRVGELERTISQLRKEVEETSSNDELLPNELDPTSPFAQLGLMHGRLRMESDAIEDHLSTGFVNLLQVTKLHEALEHDRGRHERHLANLESHIIELKAKLEDEKTKRRDEGMIALKEGGRFVVHKANERVLRFVWYEESASTLNWALQKLNVVDGQLQTIPVKSQPIHLVSEVSTGTDHFPEKTIFSWEMLRTLMQGRWSRSQGKRLLDPDQENCFSIVFSNNKALNLEIPEGGNGRSRDAWVEALQALMLK